MLQTLLQKIDDRKFIIGIIGLGYVGLPLAWSFYQKGFTVLGLDIDQSKIDAITNGESYIKHFGEGQMKEMASSGRVSATTDFSRCNEADVLIMCVPTPLNKNREPDMSYVEGTTQMLAPYIKKGHLIVLESTTYPGTTDELIRPICEKASGMTSGKDFYLAYSPEREDPGNKNFKTATIPKVLGADGEDALALALHLYQQAIVRVVPVSSTRTAEAVKLLENIYRSVNIALVNELKVVFQKMDIDVYEVIDAAKTKPFGFTAFYPGPGLGGHCIPIDPFYLTWKAREYGLSTRFIELAGEVNTAMPQYVIDRTIEALNDHSKALKGSKVLLVGLAYKPDIDDMRESPTFHLMDLLAYYKADISYYDPFFPSIPPTREHANWTGKKSVEWNKETLKQYDAIVISTNHSNVDYDLLSDLDAVIIDTRNTVSADKVRHLVRS